MSALGCPTLFPSTQFATHITYSAPTFYQLLPTQQYQGSYNAVKKIDPVEDFINKYKSVNTNSNPELAINLFKDGLEISNSNQSGYPIFKERRGFQTLSDKNIDENYNKLFGFCLSQYNQNPHQQEIMDLINRSKLAIKREIFRDYLTGYPSPFPCDLSSIGPTISSYQGEPRIFGSLNEFTIKHNQPTQLIPSSNVSSPRLSQESLNIPLDSLEDARILENCIDQFLETHLSKTPSIESSSNPTSQEKEFLNSISKVLKSKDLIKIQEDELNVAQVAFKKLNNYLCSESRSLENKKPLMVIAKIFESLGVKDKNIAYL